MSLSLQLDVPRAAGMSGPKDSLSQLWVLRAVCSSPSHPAWSLSPLGCFLFSGETPLVVALLWETHDGWERAACRTWKPTHFWLQEGGGNIRYFMFPLITVSPWTRVKQPGWPTLGRKCPWGPAASLVCHSFYLPTSLTVHYHTQQRHFFTPELSQHSTAASAESDQPKLCTMSLTSATHSALQLRASAREEMCWKLQNPWPVFHKSECCEELG